jgi:hypothetical protein
VLLLLLGLCCYWSRVVVAEIDSGKFPEQLKGSPVIDRCCLFTSWGCADGDAFAVVHYLCSPSSTVTDSAPEATTAEASPVAVVLLLGSQSEIAPLIIKAIAIGMIYLWPVTVRQTHDLPVH